MERRSSRGRRVHGECVTLQAEQVYVTALQQTRVGRAMGGMAGDAALSLEGGMLPRERTGLVRMAGEANHILRGRGTQLFLHETTMLIVAIGAGDQSFIDAMMKRLGEIRLDFQMAAVTEVGLRNLQKLAIYLGRVHGVAVHAAHIILKVWGAEEIGVLFAELMTGKTTLG